MKCNISKELFEAVMGIEVERLEVTNIKINYSKAGQCQEDDELKFLLMSFTIGINDFFFKCKEWAFENFNCEIYTSTTYGYILDKDNNLAHESIDLK